MLGQWGFLEAMCPCVLVLAEWLATAQGHGLSPRCGVLFKEPEPSWHGGEAWGLAKLGFNPLADVP